MSSCPCGFSETRQNWVADSPSPREECSLLRVSLRFLRCGRIDTVAPSDFATRSPEEQRDWARAALGTYTNEALLDAIANFPHLQRQGYGDEAPQASAMEKAEPEDEAGAIIVQTSAWALFASGAGMDIEERAHTALTLS
jgi:hypothetical protein